MFPQVSPRARQIAPPEFGGFPVPGLGTVAAFARGAPAQAVNGAGPRCPKGYHPAKVYVRGMGYQRIGHCVKIRRRNPYNRAAARRSAARLRSLGRGMKTIKKSVKAAARELD